MECYLGVDNAYFLVPQPCPQPRFIAERQEIYSRFWTIDILTLFTRALISRPPTETLAVPICHPRLWSGTWRSISKPIRGIMTISNESTAREPTLAVFSHPDDHVSNGAVTTSQPQKLHGRAFYESIGSPKFVLAPMVDQSEFVRSFFSLSGPYSDLNAGMANALPIIYVS